jgi:carbon starvation protein
VSLSSGAVSGWHTLVSSFSTAQLVEKEPQAKTITTRAMFGETIVVALIVIFAATFGVSSGFFNAGQDYLLAVGPANIFATGISRSWITLGVSESLGISLSAFLLTVMFLAVLHLAIRYASTVQSESIGKRFFLLRKRSISTLIVLTISFFLILFGLRESLWILFAGVNQLLASIVLLFASIWLLKQGKKIWWTILPAIFLFLTGMVAIFYSAVYQPLLAGYSFDSNIIAQISFANLISILFAIFFILACGYIFFIGVRKVKQRGVKNRGPLV